MTRVHRKRVATRRSQIYRPRGRAEGGRDATLRDDHRRGGRTRRAWTRYPQPGGRGHGRIVDVIVDRAGLVRAAVIDFGGFLGVGSRKIVVDWNALHSRRVANKSDSITLELTKDQVTAAPEYKEDTPIVVLGASGSLQPLQPGP
jgi:hypothetical protein